MTSMRLGRTITTAVISGALLIALFAAVNAGLPLRSDDNAAPSVSPDMAFSVLGLLSLLSIVIAFGRGSEHHRRQEHERTGPTFHVVLHEYSLAGVLAIGVVQGALLCAAMVICRGFAVDSGAPGSLWSDLGSSAPAVIAVFAAAWAVTNLGVAFASLATLTRRSGFLSILSVVVFVLIGVGMMMAFRWLNSAGGGLGLIVACTVLLVSLPLILGARSAALRSRRDDRIPV